VADRGTTERCPAGKAALERGSFGCANDMVSNGELMVQAVALRHAPAGRPVIVFDVGANVGEWTVGLLKTADAASRLDVRIHSFEPCSGTFELFRRNVGSAALESGQVIAVQKALSNATGTAVLNVVCGWMRRQLSACG